MFDHLSHPFLLSLHVSLVFLGFVLFALLRCHLLDLFLLCGDLFANFFLLLLISLVGVFLGFSAWHLFAIFLALSTSLIRQLDTHHFVNDAEHDLKDFEGVCDGLFRVADINFGSHEDIVLVVDLLIGDMELLKTVTILLESFSHTLVDQLIGNFFVLAKGDQVVDLALLTGFLLVSGRFGHGQIGCANWVQKGLKVLMHFHGCFGARFFG